MPDVTGLDPRTPVIIGVGQSSERINGAGYRALSPLDLAAEAATAAMRDTGASSEKVAAAVGTIAALRQFEISAPFMKAPLGHSNNVPRSVARRIGADPRRAILEVSGGQGPQHLVNELAATIAAGESQVALIVGSEAISTTRHFAKQEQRPDFSEEVEGDLEDRGFGLDGLVSEYEFSHQLTGAPEYYALFENARRARLGQTREQYDASMGALFAPFTQVAAQNPHAAAPTVRGALELVTATENNRPIADPYLRYLVARDQVNQGAAVLMTDVATARELGVDPSRWVFLHGHADLRERNLLERPDLGQAPASRLAARHALDVAGISAEKIAYFDFYSCFPVAVFNTAVDGLGLAADDPRGLTVTGGLPFFGGAGNNYSSHAIAETVTRVRARPGSYGFVGANGGSLSKYSVGIYSTMPTEWRGDDSAHLQAEIDAQVAPGLALTAEGFAIVETYTVKHNRDGSATGIVVGRLVPSDQRFLAVTQDAGTLQLLTSGEPIGAEVHARSTGQVNLVESTCHP